jgi:uncharacterized protein (TIGR00297 family)
LSFQGFPSEIELVVGISLIAILAFVAIKARAIDFSGAIAGAAICLVVFIAGGFSWLLVIVAFFVISSILTMYRYDYKKQLGSAQEKGGVRSWPNTVANGSIAGLAAVAEIITHQDIFIVAFLGAVAAAMSDTVATEIGLLSKSKPRMIVNLRRYVEPGTSGGVTLIGEIACLASAIVITGIGISLDLLSGGYKELSAAAIAVVSGAIIATNFDSLLGGTVQGRNQCTVCGARTEALTHHGVATASLTGKRLMDNNAVNLVATFSGAIVSIALFLLLIAVIP